MTLLDLRTVFVSSLLSTAICTIIVFSLWWQNRRRFLGLSFWMAAFILQWLAIVAIALRPALPDLLSILLGVPLWLAGTLLLNIGLGQFFGKPSPQRHNWLLLSVFVLVHACFTVVQPDLQARNINFSAGLAVFSLQCAWLLLRRVEAATRPATKMLGVIFCVYALVSVARIGANLAVPPGNDLFQAGLWDTLAILSYQLLFIALTLALVLMVNHRLTTEREHDIAERQRAEAALRQSEEKFTLAFKTSPYAITITRLADGKILEVNDAFSAITGFTRAEALAGSTVGLHLWANPEDRQWVVAELDRGQEIVAREFRFHTKTGAVITGLFSCRSLLWGDEPSALSSINDITARKQAEALVTASAARLVEAQRVARLGSWEWDPVGDAITGSEEFYRLFDVKPEEIARFPQFINRMHPDDRERVQQAVADALAQRRPYDTEYRIRLQDGTWRHINAKAQTFLDEQGAPKRMVGICQDITERAAHEHEIERLTRLYATLSQINQCIVRVKSRAELLQQICEVTARFCGFKVVWVGWRDPQTQQILPVARAGDDEGYLDRIKVYADDRPEGHGPAGTCIREGRSSVFNDFLNAPQALPWHEAALAHNLRAAAAFPIRFQGEVCGVFMVFDREAGAFQDQEVVLLEEAATDICFALDHLAQEDQRRQAEAALRREKTFAESLLDAPRDTVFLFDPATGQPLRWNRRFEEVSGYSRDEIARMKAPDNFYHEADLRAAGDAIGKILAAGQGLVELTLVTKTGRAIPFEYAVTVLRTDEGRTLLLSTGRDLSERKQAEEQMRATQRETARLLAVAQESRQALLGVVEDQREAEERIRQLNAGLERRVRDRTAELRASNEELEAFSYSVSHDLRAPLRAIDGFSQALLEDCVSQIDERGRDHLRRVRAATIRMGRLIDDLLRLSRVTRTELRRETVDLSMLAHAAAEDLRQAQPERTVELLIAEGVTTTGDTHLLRIALDNLLGNAWKFTGRRSGARIEFGATAGEGGATLFFVRDNGVGFDLQYAPKLFGAFQRLHSVQEFPGTGIGLALVQRIIHRHGGRVWAEGAVGKGATISFTLGGEV